MNRTPKGSLIIIGGHEAKDTEGELAILREVAARAKRGNRRLALVTVATSLPEAVAAEYAGIFKSLGVATDVVDIRIREEAFDERRVETIKKAAVVFFTGGDQLRISSQIGDSPVFQCMRDLYVNGGTLVGTSAGAAAMSATMLVSGNGDESSKISALEMAPGLAFLNDAVVDSHFAERGRIGRLLGAVAQNPRNLGLGIDEDTAIVVEREKHFTVIGDGAVYVVDGSPITYSSLSDEHPAGILSIYDVRMHVLGSGDVFDLTTRQPILPEAARRAGD